MGMIATTALGGAMADDYFRFERILGRFRVGRKQVIRVRAKHAKSIALGFHHADRATLGLQHDRGWTTLEGQRAMHATTVLLASTNQGGAGARTVQSAVDQIEHAGNSSRFLSSASRRNGWRGDRVVSVLNRMRGKLLASPNVASKRWAFEQYDSIVGSRTVRRPESADAAVLQLPEADTAIAVAIDGNGRRVACDPYAGAIEAVLECAQNLACVGAEPLGLTNCLNFGNPEKPNVAWQLDRAVQALADACTELGIPVVGGNVSLYNETDRGPIYPTPVVGLVGELPDPERAGGVALTEGDAIALVGPFAPSLAGTELAKARGELGPGLPGVDLDAHRKTHAFVREAVRAGRVRTAHDVSDGGLACALAEMAIAGEVGLEADLDELVEARGCSGEAAMFGEGPGGFLLAGGRDELRRLGAEAGVIDLFVLGAAGGDRIAVSAAESEVEVALTDAERAWRSLPSRLEGVESAVAA
jgi:phosphoribosylformylglycinamidine (FGAM) synthase-like enzyme